jgi:hypothetical protein
MLGPDVGGAAITGLVVATVTMAVTGVTPSVGVTEVGATVHVDIVGAPAHASATARLKPPAGVTVTVKVPLAPWATVRVVGDAVTVKLAAVFVPVPLNVTV